MYTNTFISCSSKNVHIETNKFIFISLQLYLPDGIPTDVLVTSVVSCNHIFIQQILHSSYPELARLDNSMSVFYHHTEMTPLLPRPIQRN
jgi:A-kinase anchor protein 1